MFLKINDADNILQYPFFSWLIDKIKIKLLSDMQISRLSSLQQEAQKIYDEDIDLQKILLQAINNLVIIPYTDYTTIGINPNIFANNLDRIKLSDVCKFINYGNSAAPGYPIFTDTFRYISENIKDYTFKYLYGL